MNIFYTEKYGFLPRKASEKIRNRGQIYWIDVHTHVPLFYLGSLSCPLLSSI